MASTTEPLAIDVISDPSGGLSAGYQRFADALGDRYAAMGGASLETDAPLIQQLEARWSLFGDRHDLAVYEASQMPALAREWTTYESHRDFGFELQGATYVLPIDPVENPLGYSAAQQMGGRRSRGGERRVIPAAGGRRRDAQGAPQPKELWRKTAQGQLSSYPAAMGQAGAVEPSLLRFPDLRATQVHPQGGSVSQPGAAQLRGPEQGSAASRRGATQAQERFFVEHAPGQAWGGLSPLVPALGAAEALTEGVIARHLRRQTEQPVAWIVPAALESTQLETLSRVVGSRLARGIGLAGVEMLSRPDSAAERSSLHPSFQFAQRPSDIGELIQAPEGLSPLDGAAQPGLAGTARRAAPQQRPERAAQLDAAPRAAFVRRPTHGEGAPRLSAPWQTPAALLQAHSAAPKVASGISAGLREDLQRRLAIDLQAPALPPVGAPEAGRPALPQSMRARGLVSSGALLGASEPAALRQAHAAQRGPAHRYTSFEVSSLAQSLSARHVEWSPLNGGAEATSHLQARYLDTPILGRSAALWGAQDPREDQAQGVAFDPWMRDEIGVLVEAPSGVEAGAEPEAGAAVSSRAAAASQALRAAQVGAAQTIQTPAATRRLAGVSSPTAAPLARGAQAALTFAQRAEVSAQESGGASLAALRSPSALTGAVAAPAQLQAAPTWWTPELGSLATSPLLRDLAAFLAQAPRALSFEAPQSGRDTLAALFADGPGELVRAGALPLDAQGAPSALPSRGAARTAVAARTPQAQRLTSQATSASAPLISHQFAAAPAEVSGPWQRAMERLPGGLEDPLGEGAPLTQRVAAQALNAQIGGVGAMLAALPAAKDFSSIRSWESGGQLIAALTEMAKAYGQSIGLPAAQSAALDPWWAQQAGGAALDETWVSLPSEVDASSDTPSTHSAPARRAAAARADQQRTGSQTAISAAPSASAQQPSPAQQSSSAQQRARQAQAALALLGGASAAAASAHVRAAAPEGGARALRGAAMGSRSWSLGSSTADTPGTTQALGGAQPAIGQNIEALYGRTWAALPIGLGAESFSAAQSQFSAFGMSRLLEAEAAPFDAFWSEPLGELVVPTAWLSDGEVGAQQLGSAGTPGRARAAKASAPARRSESISGQAALRAMGAVSRPSVARPAAASALAALHFADQRLNSPAVGARAQTAQGQAVMAWGEAAPLFMASSGQRAPNFSLSQSPVAALVQAFDQAEARPSAGSAPIGQRTVADPRQLRGATFGGADRHAAQLEGRPAGAGSAPAWSGAALFGRPELPGDVVSPQGVAAQSGEERVGQPGFVAAQSTRATRQILQQKSQFFVQAVKGLQLGQTITARNMGLGQSGGASTSAARSAAVSTARSAATAEPTTSTLAQASAVLEALFADPTAPSHLRRRASSGGFAGFGASDGGYSGADWSAVGETLSAGPTRTGSASAGYGESWGGASQAGASRAGYLPGNVGRALVAFSKAAREAGLPSAGSDRAASSAFSGGWYASPGALLTAAVDAPAGGHGSAFTQRAAPPTIRPSIRLPGSLFADRGPVVSLSELQGGPSRVMVDTTARAEEHALRSTPGMRPDRKAETNEEARHRNAEQSEDTLSPEEVDRIARDVIARLEKEAEADQDLFGEDFD